MEKIGRIILICSVASQACAPYHRTVKLKVNSAPIQFVDTITEETIPEVLVIPQYVSIKTKSTPFDRTGPGVYEDYVAGAFIYRKGGSFRPVESKGNGVTWFPGCGFTGREVLMKGALVLAPGYEPRWYSTSMLEDHKGALGLAPISVQESVRKMGALLNQIEKGVLRMPDECTHYYLDPCVVEVRFDKADLEAVRSFFAKG